MNTILQKRIEEKSKELAQKYFPNEMNIWARGNLEARYVESACKEIATFSLQNQWISVDEALPEYDERVLVAHQYGCQVASFYKDNSHQYCGVAKESPIGADVTHWMNIPSLGGGEK